MGSYLRPTRLEEALEALALGPRVVIAGGTDYYPARVGRPLDDEILDITALNTQRAISHDAQGWRIPALATWRDIIDADLPPLFDGLKRAARDVGGMQIQNTGTVCGNVCNASPAADGVPNLLALDASIELASLAGRRTLPIGDFVLGNRRTARRADELVTAILVSKPQGSARSTFLKLGARRYLVISIVMVAAVVEMVTANKIAAARISVGSCAATARRLADLEHALTGRALTDDLAGLVQPDHLAPLTPIDDVRGTAAYRRDATQTLLRRALRELAA